MVLFLHEHAYFSLLFMFWIRDLDTRAADLAAVGRNRQQDLARTRMYISGAGWIGLGWMDGCNKWRMRDGGMGFGRIR
jgi:hypothetical protein